MRHSRQSRIALLCGSGQGGQALLIAVLLMMAILLIGILFVAIVTYNQSASARHEDMLLAQALAEGGIRYADHMLVNSAQGADWRPPDPPSQYDGDGSYDPGFWGEDGVEGTEDDYYTETEIVRGWAPLRDGTVGAPGGYIRRGFTRYPDPRQPGSTSALVNNFTLGRGYFLLRITYDPDPPYETGDAGVPDPMSRHIKIEAIGRVEDNGQVQRRLVAYKPLPLLNYLRYVTDATNTGKPAQLGIAPFIDMDNNGTLEWLDCVFDGPIRINSSLQVAGAPSGAEASTKFYLTTPAGAGAYLRDDSFQAAAGIELLDDVANAAEVSVDGAAPAPLLESDDPAFTTYGGRVADGTEAVDAAGDSRFTAALSPPSLTVSGEVTGAERYRELTRDSGDLVAFAGSYVNNGQWGHGAGIYVSNFDDVQFKKSNGDHDIEALIDDWQRPQSAGGLNPADSGWNALYTTYAPYAVTIELLPTEAAVGPYSTTLPVDEDAGQVWWPSHVAGEPGIKLSLSSSLEDENWKAPDGSDSGLRTMVVDYPLAPNQVVFAEGNVRVTGELPPAARDVGGNLTRSYDLTIVSDATVYIDGQILSAQDVAPAVIDEDNTKVALLARDCVCLNTTQIVPQLTTGAVSAAPDDEENPDDRQQHWELTPGSDGRAYSTWRWGPVPPAPNVSNLGVAQTLVAKQTAGEPGPSGMGLTVWTASAGHTAHAFGNPVDASTFLFVPPGTRLPDPPWPPLTDAPTSYCSTAIAPTWERLWEPSGMPAVPWSITASADSSPGAKNGIILRHKDPGLAGGSTDYWVKKWKVEEFNAAGDAVGAIRACVNAAVYAERGCWYVLAADYFDSSATGADAVRFRRYNYKVTFKGTISENFTARVETVRDWTDRTAYPAYDEVAPNAFYWGTIEYNFDETLRVVRDQALGATLLASAQSNQPKLPLLPVSPDLVYYGEAQ